MKHGKGFLLILALLVPLSGAVWAQGRTYQLGRTPTPEEIKAWDIAIGPEGKELPPGRGTIQQGERIFAQKFAKCHGPTGTEVKFLHGALVGGFGSLTTLQPLKTVGSYYPYPTTIFDYINRSMPYDRPSSLSPDEVYSVVAFLFYRNNIIKESDTLDAGVCPRCKCRIEMDSSLPSQSGSPDTGSPISRPSQSPERRTPSITAVRRCYESIRAQKPTKAIEAAMPRKKPPPCRRGWMAQA